MQDHDEFTVGEGLQLPDSVDSHDRGPVDPQKLLRIERLLDRGKRVVDQMGFALHMEAHVVARGFEPVDGLDGNKRDATGILEGEAPSAAGAGSVEASWNMRATSPTGGVAITAG